MKPLKKLLPLFLLLTILFNPLLSLNELIKIQLNESSNQFLINLSEKNLSIDLTQYTAYLGNNQTLSNLSYLIDKQNNTYLFYNSSLSNLFDTFYLVKEGASNIIPISDGFFLITINNPNSYNLTDFQVKVNITNITQNIGYNFKILDQNNNPIPFCFEQVNGECNETLSNIIWVKVPFIPANGATTLKIVEDLVNNAVNGDQVFDFYDDFNDGVLDSNKWIIVNPTAGTYVESNGLLSIKSSGDNWNTADTSLLLISKVNFSYSYVAETYIFSYTYDSWQRFFGVRASTATNSPIFVLLNDNDGSHITNVYRDSYGARAGYYGDNTGVLRPNAPFLAKIIVNGYTVSSYINNQLTNQRTYNYLLSYVYLTDTNTQTNFPSFNWIRVRKYADTEPTYTIQELQLNVSQLLSYLKNFNFTEYKLYLNTITTNYPLPNYFNFQNLTFIFNTIEQNIIADKIISINGTEYNQTSFDLFNFKEGYYTVDYGKVTALVEGFLLEDIFNISKWFRVDDDPTLEQKQLIQLPITNVFKVITYRNSYILGNIYQDLPDSIYTNQNYCNFKTYYYNYSLWLKCYNSTAEINDLATDITENYYLDDGIKFKIINNTAVYPKANITLSISVKKVWFFDESNFLALSNDDLYQCYVNEINKTSICQPLNFKVFTECFDLVNSTYPTYLHYYNETLAFYTFDYNNSKVYVCKNKQALRLFALDELNYSQITNLTIEAKDNQGNLLFYQKNINELNLYPEDLDYNPIDGQVWFGVENSNYPKRKYLVNILKLTSYTQIAYLLDLLNGMMYQFVVKDTQGNPVSDVLITIQKRDQITGNWVVIAQEKSSVDGSAQIWLQPYQEYKIILYKDGQVKESTFTTSNNNLITVIFNPSTTTGGIEININSYLNGLKYYWLPENDTLKLNDSLTFNLVAGNVSLDEWGLEVYKQNWSDFILVKTIRRIASPQGGAITLTFNETGKYVIKPYVVFVNNITKNYLMPKEVLVIGDSILDGINFKNFFHPLAWLIITLILAFIAVQSVKLFGFYAQAAAFLGVVLFMFTIYSGWQLSIISTAGLLIIIGFLLIMIIMRW